jgi:NitT/TauT family transport system permease protein
MKLSHNKRFQVFTCVLIIIVAWEVSTRAGWVNGYILPPFDKVCTELYKGLFGGKLGWQTLSSLRVVFMGFALSIALSVIITLLCVASGWLSSLFDTLTTVLTPLPSVAVLPLIIMWFGINTTAIYVLILHGVLWTMTRHLLDGLRSVPKTYIEFGRNIALPPHRMFFDIVIFAIMPELLAGLRTSWGRAWRALISAEMVFGMISSTGGIGYFIYMARAYARTTDVFAGIIVIAGIGIFAEYFVFSQIECLTTRKWGITHD